MDATWSGSSVWNPGAPSVSRHHAMDADSPSPRKRSSLFRRRLPTTPTANPVASPAIATAAASLGASASGFTSSTPSPQQEQQPRTPGAVDGEGTTTPGDRLRSLFRRRLPQTPPAIAPRSPAAESSPGGEIRRLQDRVKHALARIAHLKDKRGNSDPLAHVVLSPRPGPAQPNGLTEQEDLLNLKEALSLLTAEVGALPSSPTRSRSSQRRRKLPTPRRTPEPQPVSGYLEQPSAHASSTSGDGDAETAGVAGVVSPPTDMFSGAANSPLKGPSVSTGPMLHRNSSDSFSLAAEPSKQPADGSSNFGEKNEQRQKQQQQQQQPERFGPDLADLRGFGTGRSASAHRQYGCRCCNCRYLLSAGRSMYPRGRAAHPSSDDKMVVRPWQDVVSEPTQIQV